MIVRDPSPSRLLTYVIASTRPLVTGPRMHDRPTVRVEGWSVRSAVRPSKPEDGWCVGGTVAPMWLPPRPTRHLQEFKRRGTDFLATEAGATPS